ncbi:dienelactone hydrolase [Aspergillus bombycis]|uniref:Dienelactone hydrolase n=1 Tax=Aspergillus bombycis TaxID=109264 RepID=A0A1F7ZMA0_9EURO|nr:dienelactone hydrolase [Aspergillus bombycis]OGM40597.1 dienelactone hydrolase [Aspergillus bombycis]
MSCDACRTLPPVIPQGYTTKGAYKEVAGLNTCKSHTDPQEKQALTFLRCYWPTGCVHGACSPLRHLWHGHPDPAGGGPSSYKIEFLSPGARFFEGNFAQAEWFPTDTEEKKNAIASFVSNEASIPRNVDTLLEITKRYNTLFPSVSKWAALGLCWASGPGTPFVATGQVHPGRADKTDAEKLAIPHIVLASKDEPAEEIQGYTDVISTNGIGGHVETYSTMWHGWMGARANLDSEESNAEYRRGYTQVADFFEKYLK